LGLRFHEFSRPAESPALLDRDALARQRRRHPRRQFLFGSQSATTTLIQGVLGLILLIPSLAIAIKRYHDRDKSGWWILILFIPLVGFIWFLIELGCLPGTPGPNRYGPDPLGAEPFPVRA